MLEGGDTRDLGLSRSKKPSPKATCLAGRAGRPLEVLRKGRDKAGLSGVPWWPARRQNQVSLGGEIRSGGDRASISVPGSPWIMNFWETSAIAIEPKINCSSPGLGVVGIEKIHS